MRPGSQLPSVMTLTLPFSPRRGAILRIVATATASLAAATRVRAQAALDDVAAAAPDVLARNKRSVIEFYDLAFNKSKPREAVERYVGDSYKQHNPEVPDGKDGFIWYFEKMAKDYPGKKLVMRRVFAEGNHVIVHCWSRFPAWLGDSEFVAIDIFRLDDNGKIVEHWDVLQKVPRASSTNLNSMI
jgi:predicted SnoaL-like aldol condensation-catalyzing enzyme